MNLSHFLITIRWQNVFIIWLMQSVVYFLYVVPYCGHDDYSFISFLLFLGATGTVLSAGNIYNDLRDIGTDALQQNKPKIVGHEISVPKAWNWYYILTGISILFSITGWAFFGWPLLLVVIFLLGTVLLYLYSTYLKATILAGNILVAILCALSVWMTIFLAPSCDLIPGIFAEGRIPVILTGYIANAFLITVLREVIKDKEDAAADIKTGIFTIGSIPESSFKMVFNGLLIIISMVNIYWFYWLQSVISEPNLNLGLLMIFIPLLMITLIFNLPYKAKIYSFLSKLIKVYILFAILLLILWQRG